MKGKFSTITRLERVQNQHWFLQYLIHQESFAKRLHCDTERRLYHGCPEQAADSIIKTGFNRSYAGENGKCA